MEIKFYRSQLATIVWDSINEKILADFKNGYFITSDKRTINILRELNYPEVEINSVVPPPGLEVKPPAIELKGSVPLMSPNISEKLGEQKFVEAMKNNSENIKTPILKKNNNVKINQKPKIKRIKGLIK